MTPKTQTPPTPKTADEVKARLHTQGLTVKQWAIAHDYPVPEVYKILSGERKGLYGRGHEIAVRLGLKIPLDPSNL